MIKHMWIVPYALGKMLGMSFIIFFNVIISEKNVVN